MCQCCEPVNVRFEQGEREPLHSCDCCQMERGRCNCGCDCCATEEVSVSSELELTED